MELILELTAHTDSSVIYIIRCVNKRLREFAESIRGTPWCRHSWIINAYAKKGRLPFYHYRYGRLLRKIRPAGYNNRWRANLFEIKDYTRGCWIIFRYDEFIDATHYNIDTLLIQLESTKRFGAYMRVGEIVYGVSYVEGYLCYASGELACSKSIWYLDGAPDIGQHPKELTTRLTGPEFSELERYMGV